MTIHLHQMCKAIDAAYQDRLAIMLVIINDELSNV